MSHSIYDRLHSFGIPVTKRSGQEKTICPKCSHTRKNTKEKCLSANLDSGMFNCKHCSFSGTGAEYSAPKKVYVKPVWQNVTALPDEVVKWWARRGISQRTLNMLNVGFGRKWMYGTKNAPEGETWVVKFPYVRKGELVNVKSRSEDKRFMMETGAELIFWNIDAIENSEEAMIVEGEPDVMSALEADYLPVISVPNGASEGSNKLEYLDNCIQYFFDNEGKPKHKKIIIATDDDPAGRALRDELVRRLGAERCWLVDFGYSRSRPDVKWKDHNEVLAGKTLPTGEVVPGDGKLVLGEVYKNAKPCPIKDVVTADQLAADVFDLFKKGLPPGDSVYLTDADGDLVTFVGSQNTIVTGIPSHGKSSFLDFITGILAVKHGWKFGVFSPENWPLQLHVSKLIELLIGKTFSANTSPGNRITHDEIIQALVFIQDHFFFISPDEYDMSLTDLLSLAKKMVQRFGIRGLIIDPWNTLEHQRPPNEMVDQYVSKSLGQIEAFDRNTGTHTFVVAHPAKMEKDRSGNYPVPKMYDISGGANWYNKAYNGVCVYRKFAEGIVEVHVQKVKFKHQGHLGKLEMTYNYRNGRYHKLNTTPDNRNWLTEGCGPLPPIPVYQTSDVVVAGNSAPDEEKDDHPF